MDEKLTYQAPGFRQVPLNTEAGFCTSPPVPGGNEGIDYEDF